LNDLLAALRARRPPCCFCGDPVPPDPVRVPVPGRVDDLACDRYCAKGARKRRGEVEQHFRDVAREKKLEMGR